MSEQSLAERPLEERLANYDSLTIDQRKDVWVEISPNMTRQQLDDFLAGERARQALVPPLGAAAPEFELDRLDRQRQRTGETVRLSDLRGTPVGIIFGSWT